MQDIQRVLKAAGWRLFVVDVLRTGVVTLTVVVAALFALKVVEKLFPIAFDWSILFAVAGASAVLVALLWAFLRRQRGLGLAQEVDERAGLREAISTAMCVEGCEDGWSRAVVETAQERARRVVVRDAVPIETPRAWQAPVILALALLTVWWLPNYDLTGLMAKKEQEEKQLHEVQKVMADIKVDEEKLEDLLRKAGIEDGAGDEEPAVDPQQANPKKVDEIRRQALKKLTKLGEQLKAKQESGETKKLEAMQKQLKQLRTPGDGPMTDFARSLARSNFSEAKEKLEEAAEQLAQGDMKPEDKAKAAEQLENLKEQLEELAENSEQIEQALKETGMNAEQAAEAASDPEALQEALEKMEGLSDEQKQAIQQAAQAQQQASESMSDMAGAMSQMAQAMSQEGQDGQPGQAGQEGASALSDQLSQMEAAAQEAQNLSAAMGEAQSQMNQLGQAMGEPGSGQCFGGGQGQFAEGDSSKPGGGMGGPGRGSGGAMDSEQTDYALEQIKQNVANQGGPIISETIVYGAQVRGESTKTFQSAVTEAKALSTEALESKVVPKQYAGAIQHYFGRLEAVAKAKKGEDKGEDSGEDSGEDE
jgi:methyl-accepting chemotaxis protein